MCKGPSLVSSDPSLMHHFPARISGGIWKAYAGKQCYMEADCFPLRHIRISTLDHINQEIQAPRDGSCFKRAWSYTKDPVKIIGLKESFDGAVALFQV